MVLRGMLQEVSCILKKGDQVKLYADVALDPNGRDIVIDFSLNLKYIGMTSYADAVKMLSHNLSNVQSIDIDLSYCLSYLLDSNPNFSRVITIVLSGSAVAYHLNVNEVLGSIIPLHL